VKIDLKIKKDIPLAPLSTFHIGGEARQFIDVHNSDQLVEVVRWAKKTNKPFKIFAGGSNAVFPDEVLDCLVIQILGGNIAVNMRELFADAGVELADLVAKSIELGLSGLESLSGIPGTVGGAVVGNAGAYGLSISEIVERVEIWDGEKRRWLDNKECEFSYRESIFKKKPYLVLRVVCKFQQGDNEKLKTISKEIIKQRQKKYRPGLKCPGSFFKNILEKEIDEDTLSYIDNTKIVYGKIPAGFLLEQVGAKGMRVGGIEIASFHGNLFINSGGGTAADVKKLAQILKGKVKEKFGIELEEEIRYF